MNFTYGKYEYKLEFNNSIDEKAWQTSLKRNAKSQKIKKMSLTRRNGLMKIKKPNITQCVISRRRIGSTDKFTIYSTMEAKRSVTDTFNEMYGKRAALRKTLEKAGSDRKKPNKTFRIAAWTVLNGKLATKMFRVKKHSSHNKSGIRGICCPVPPKGK